MKTSKYRGTAVYHLLFGLGKVDTIEENSISVLFQGFGNKSFRYPDIFYSHLCLESQSKLYKLLIKGNSKKPLTEADLEGDYQQAFLTFIDEQKTENSLQIVEFENRVKQKNVHIIEYNKKDLREGKYLYFEGFTSENLIKIGWYDELYSLYRNMLSIYETAYEAVRKDAEKSMHYFWSAFLDPNQLQTLHSLHVRFLEDHLSTLVDKNTSIPDLSKSAPDMPLLNEWYNVFWRLIYEGDKGGKHIVTFEQFLLYFAFSLGELIQIARNPEDFKNYKNYKNYRTLFALLDFYKKTHTYRVAIIHVHVLQHSLYFARMLEKNALQLLEEIQKENDPLQTQMSALNEEPLYLYDALNPISCNRKGHPIIFRKYRTARISDDFTITLPVHYCDSCKKYFIGKKTLEMYTKEYGKLIVTVKRDSFTDESLFDSFDKESKLHALGYNVVANGMSDAERQALLKYLLTSHKITYFEICKDIENAIGLFRNRTEYSDAVAKWKKDLKYVGEYMKSIQP